MSLDDPVEQLWFTWSLRGLSGMNDYQPVAASPGLRTVSSAMVRDVIKVCRYVAPRGSTPDVAPVAFGWLDRGDARIAFCRTAVGPDGRGRPGNFVAHALVGPPENLPADAVLACWRSPRWVRHPMIEKLDDQEVDLPRVPLRGFVVDAPPTSDEPDAAEDLIAALLAATPRQTVAARLGADVLVSSTRAALTLVPALLEGGGFSTYEPATQARPYTVVGLPDRQPAPPAAIEVPIRSVPLTARDLARRLCDTRAEGHHLARVAVDLAEAARTPGAPRSDAREVLQNHAALERFVASGSLEAATVDRIARRPQALRLFCETEVGRRAVAIALVDGPEPLWISVGKAELPNRVASLLADDLAAQTIERADPSVTSGVLAQSARAGGTLDAHFRGGLAARLASALSVGRVLDPAGAWAVLDASARLAGCADRPEGLLRRAGERPELAARHPSVPAAWRTSVVAGAIASGSVPRRTALRLALDDAALVPSVVASVRPEVWASLADACLSDSPMLGVLVGAVDPHARAGVVSTILERRAPEERAEVITRCVTPRLIAAERSVWPWDEIVGRVADETLATRARSLGRSLVPPAELTALLRASGFPGVWGGVVQAVAAARGPDVATLAGTLGHSPDPASLDAAFELLLLAKGDSLTTVVDLVRRLGAGAAASWEDSLTRAGLRACRAPGGGGQAPEVVLMALLDAVSSRRVRMHRARLESSLAHRLATELAAGLTGAAVERLGGFARSNGGPAERWWNDLAPRRSSRLFGGERKRVIGGRSRP